MIGEPSFVKKVGSIRADQFLYLLSDLVLSVRKPCGLQHIALLQHPASEAHATEYYGITGFVDDGLAGGTQK